jgi:hypothetical protein
VRFCINAKLGSQEIAWIIRKPRLTETEFAEFSVHPGTFLTIFGPASDKLIINSKALRRRVQRSSRSSSFSLSSVEFCKLDGPADEGDEELDCEDFEGGGNTNTPPDIADTGKVYPLLV